MDPGSSSSSRTGRDFIHDDHTFACYSEDGGGSVPFYTLQKGPETEFLSAVDLNGEAVLITRKALPLSQILQNLPLWTQRSERWIGEDFKKQKHISALVNDTDFRCLSHGRRVIAAGLLRTIIPRWKVMGKSFGNLSPDSIFVELAPHQSGLAADDLSCTIHIVPQPTDSDISRRRTKAALNNDLTALKQILFGHIFPQNLSNDLLILQNDLQNMNRILNNAAFISEHPSLWSSKKRLIEMQNFLETYTRFDNNGILKKADEFSFVMDYSRGDVEQTIGKKWTDVVKNFDQFSPVSYVFFSGNVEYANNSLDLYKYFRNFKIHRGDTYFSVPGRVNPYIPLYNDDDFVDNLLSKMFPGLVNTTFEDAARRGLYFSPM